MLRDNDPYDKARVVTVNPAFPTMNSNSSLFDSLYALGIREMELCLEKRYLLLSSSGPC